MSDKKNGNEIKKAIEPDLNKGRTITPLVKPNPAPPPPKDTGKK